MRAVNAFKTVDLESKRKALEAIVGKVRWSQTGAVLLLRTEYSTQRLDSLWGTQRGGVVRCVVVWLCVVCNCGCSRGVVRLW